MGRRCGMTVMVDWSYRTNYLFTYLSIPDRNPPGDVCVVRWVGRRCGMTVMVDWA